MANRTNDLTPKQQHFCRAVASGCTMSDAYREAYSAGRMKPATINREAHTLMAIPKITTRVEALQRAKDRAVIVSSLSDRERVLTKLRDKMDNGQSDMSQLRAAELLGKSVSLFKDVQVQEVQRSPEEIRAELEELMAEVFEADSAVHLSEVAQT
jgi:phage terminase small subunit